jgi:uncharacterized protein with von Willebrand factor type A (vWA) domain
VRHLPRRRRSLHKRLSAYTKAVDWNTSPLAENVKAREERLESRVQSLLSQPAIQSFLRDHQREAGAVESELNSLVRLAGTVVTKKKRSERDPEQALLAEFRAEDAQALPRRWTKISRYRKLLVGSYKEDQFPVGKYDRQAKLLRKASGKETKDSSEALKKAILENWESAVKAKQRRSQAQEDAILDLQILNTMETLFSRFRELQRLIGPIQNYLAFSWDLSSAILHESLFELVKKAGDILQKNDSIREIARRLGRLQQAERKYLDERLRDSSKPERWAILRAAKSSLVGVRESDDISSMISSEATLLLSRETESLFYMKFVEKKLLTYDYQVEERSQTLSPLMKAKKSRLQRRGPIIIAVDTSGSMQGDAEESAKALAFALTRIAFSQRRDVHVISFSNDAESITLSPSKEGSLEKLIRFLLMSFHGGTDLEVGLDNALGKLREATFRQADVVFLTDGMASRIDPTRVTAMDAARAEGVRFYTILVGNGANPDLFAQFDFNWQFRDDQLFELSVNLDKFRRSELRLALTSQGKIGPTSVDLTT